MSDPGTKRTGGTVWTDPQHEAIRHDGGDLLVSAAAGSGKTAVLAERCARLVCDFQCPPERRTGVEHLLVVTFTEAAAAEMRTRIARAIDRTLQQSAGEDLTDEQRAWLRRQAAMVDRATISTLHAFCARTLRQHFHEADIDPAFAVMDEDESRLLRDEVLRTLMARWHTQPTGGSRAAEAFAEFFQSYGQGEEKRCSKMILALHHMLSTTADPEEWVKAAQAVYADAEGTLERYARETLAGRMDRALLVAQRALDEVRATEAAQPMLNRLAAAADALRRAGEWLREHGAAKWKAAHAELEGLEWKTLKRIDEIPDFDGFRKRNWDRVKSAIKDVAALLEHDPTAMRDDLRKLEKPLGTLLTLTSDFQKDFAAAKRGENRLDFNDLERLTLNLLTRPDHAVAGQLRRRYRHMLVDEFQDINPLQAALLAAVSNPAAVGGKGNLFRVGDVKQAIYGFRLAEPNLFLAQEAAARDGKGRRIALPHNFRSEPELLGVMNGIFERLLTPQVAGIAYDRDHALQPPPHHVPLAGVPNGLPVEVDLLTTKRDDEEEEEGEAENGQEQQDAPTSENLTAVEREAALVADRIATLLAEGKLVRNKDGSRRPAEPRDIAILMRAMKGHAMVFARALARKGIPFHADLASGFFDSPEIAQTLSLLHVLDNPQQDIHLAGTMLGPYGGFTHDDLALIRLTYDRHEVPFHNAVTRYAADAAREGGQADAAAAPGLKENHPPFSTDLAARLEEFLSRLAHWRERLRTQPLCEGLAGIYADSRILIYAAGLDAGTQRVANLRQLHQRALTFGTFRKQGLHRFLRFLERLRDEDALDGGNGDAGEAAVLSEASNVVRIMSVHKSKGLEFPIVIVARLGAMINLSPAELAVDRALGIGLDVINMDRNVRYPSPALLRIRDARERSLRAEELRLLYVAMTRARDCLILTGHISKANEVDGWRAEWGGHAGPLPEDALLRARRPLDWLMPALATGADPAQTPVAGGRLRVCWRRAGESVPAPAAQVAVTLHRPVAERMPASSESANDNPIASILAMETLPAADRAAAAEVLQRVQGVYPYDDLAQRSAVQTVTALKKQPAAVTLPDEELAPPALPAALEPQHAGLDEQADAARLRGIATHRVLQLLDFAAFPIAGEITPDALDRQLVALVDAGRMSQDELDRVDWQGIHWLLHESAAGKKIRTAAHHAARHPSPVHLRREIPFTCLAPTQHSELSTQNLLDLPTLRGIIDVLIASPAARTAEILDYKTDAAFLIPQRLDDYRRQMVLYLQAASDILGYPVEQATLIFLAGQREVVIRS